jgi:anti-sigma factor RsiW
MNPTPHDPEHVRIQALIPWVLNGQADNTQHAEVQQHLADCLACRADMERQQRLQAALQLPARHLPDAEQGLARLLQRIEVAALDEQPQPAASPAPPGRSPRLTRVLAACVVLQAMALVVLAPQIGRPDEAAYRTLSQVGTAPPGELRVVPVPELRLADWQALLLAEDLQVRSGPNLAGAYTLSRNTTKGELDALVLRLRAHPELRLVEALQARP